MKPDFEETSTSDSSNRTGGRDSTIILEKEIIKNLELLDLRIGGNKESRAFSLLRMINNVL